jgi:hypothetical protein
MQDFPMIDLKASDCAIVAATLMGPVLAVQAQKWVEWATDRRRRRFSIFNTLMVTRGTRLDFDHVRALNSIEPLAKLLAISARQEAI